MLLPGLVGFDARQDSRWEIVRGRPDFVQLARSAGGAWWFVDPEGRRLFSQGVGRVERLPAEPLENLAPTVAENFRRWNVNTVGPGSEAGVRPPGAWEVVDVPLGGALAEVMIRAGGLAVPDVFDPRTVEACRTLAAERCGPRRFDRGILAHRLAGPLRWEPTRAGPNGAPRPPLLQVCLALEPRFPAYHAAWEFVLAAHSGEWDRLLRDWGIDWPNRAALRQQTLEEVALATPAFRRDQDNFLREFARRFFQIAVEAVRGADPHHLVLAPAWGDSGADLLAAAWAAAEVDAVALEVAAPADLAALDRVGAGGRMPVYVSDFNWSGPRFRHAGGSSRRRTPAEQMLSQGRRALEAIARHPAVAGYAWSHWRDDEEDLPPFGRGLLRRNGTEAREHADLVAAVNRTAAANRWGRERAGRVPAAF